MTALVVRNLSKRYGGVQALRDVSFSVAAGELVALIGANGAGKTTCFNLLNGQLAPDAGEIELDGRSIVGRAPRDIWRLGVGRTFQITATFGSMTVRENVQVALVSHRRAHYSPFGLARRSAARRSGCAARAGRHAASRPSGRAPSLAYGDLKRVELAIALANSPRLLLMDEPTAGMAPEERGALMALAASLAQQRRHRRALHRARHGRRVRPRRPRRRAASGEVIAERATGGDTGRPARAGGLPWRLLEVARTCRPATAARRSCST